VFQLIIPQKDNILHHLLALEGLHTSSITKRVSENDSSNVAGVPEMSDRGQHIILWQNLSRFSVFRSRTLENVRVLYKTFTSNFICVLAILTPYRNFIPRLNNRRLSHANLRLLLERVLVWLIHRAFATLRYTNPAEAVLLNLQCFQCHNLTTPYN
jgi:hypothetical protein